ncbi:MAG: penicillin-binding transpeptidase domain-containing protein [Bacillota bacterium]
MSETTMMMRRRTVLILGGLLSFFLLLEFNLAKIQIISSNRLKTGAINQRLREMPVDALRGLIYDRTGLEEHLLAKSVSIEAVYAVPREVKDLEETVSKVSSILLMQPKRVRTLLTKKTSSVYLRYKLTPDQTTAIQKADLPGIFLAQKTQRYYPKEFLAAHVLGISGIDNQGLEGLENYYDSVLRGKRGWELAEYDSTGRYIPEGLRKFVPPVDGNTLILTIDEGLQSFAERELDKAMAETGAKRGAAILMQPVTGEILALALRPRYNPNVFEDFSPEVRRNFAITDNYEPGSTFKIVTASAALEEGVVTPETSFDDPGYIMVEDRRIKCWRAGGHGHQSFTEAMENSCNPVFARLALNLGVERLYRFVKAFGFDKQTDVDFPGEAAGQMHKREAIGPVELATAGFGQGISVTPIQLLRAACAIANGGYLLRPYLVKEIRDPKGRALAVTRRKVVRRVISGSTSRTMIRLMKSIVLNGSGHNAYVEGYRVAGKTGTAQKPSPAGGYGDKCVASFVGFAPADDPKLAGLVILDEPIGQQYGGVIAAPVFGRIFREALKYMGVKPKYEPPEEDPAGRMVPVPNVINMGADDADAILRQHKLNIRYIGTGTYIYDQLPKPGVKVKIGATILLYFDPAEKYNKYVVVPDLNGLAMREAAEKLQELGLILVPEGRGVAWSQYPPPGRKVARGTSVKISFRPL